MFEQEGTATTPAPEVAAPESSTPEAPASTEVEGRPHRRLRPPRRRPCGRCNRLEDIRSRRGAGPSTAAAELRWH